MTTLTRLLPTARLVFAAVRQTPKCQGIVVGGAAAAMLGSDRATQDIDINVTRFPIIKSPKLYARDRGNGLMKVTYEDPEGKNSIRCDIATRKAALMPLYLDWSIKNNETGITLDSQASHTRELHSDVTQVTGDNQAHDKTTHDIEGGRSSGLAGKKSTRQKGDETAQPVFRSCRVTRILDTLCNMCEIPDGDEPRITYTKLELLLADKIRTYAERGDKNNHRGATDLADIKFCITEMFLEETKMPEALKSLYTPANWDKVIRVLTTDEANEGWDSAARVLEIPH
ncbi:hypothetical protein M413DRAFT_26597 [Hebeloma cylindrosporum]|uniref:Nucleotidyl transferase AbiEii/AbiGii toxin family protein n=1 Tax=Hebeloma cylindrosporum TaxID=76867 RepID=A0A0C2YNG4_HEBCY|nr:hypothetical protein M413DRAFT_26597 [Hebeloma cylindrosporum h7]